MYEIGQSKAIRVEIGAGGFQSIFLGPRERKWHPWNQAEHHAGSTPTSSSVGPPCGARHAAGPPPHTAQGAVPLSWRGCLSPTGTRTGTGMCGRPTPLPATEGASHVVGPGVLTPSQPTPGAGKMGTRAGNMEAIGEVGDSLCWGDDLESEAPNPFRSVTPSTQWESRSPDVWGC